MESTMGAAGASRFSNSSICGAKEDLALRFERLDRIECNMADASLEELARENDRRHNRGPQAGRGTIPTGARCRRAPSATKWLRVRIRKTIVIRPRTG